MQELLQTHGYNEFSVDAPEPLLVKFAKTIYENPLILLLCGSAAVSTVMGNIDDAVSITVAVLIVLTGELPRPSIFLSPLHPANVPEWAGTNSKSPHYHGPVEVGSAF